MSVDELTSAANNNRCDMEKVFVFPVFLMRYFSSSSSSLPFCWANKNGNSHETILSESAVGNPTHTHEEEKEEAALSLIENLLRWWPHAKPSREINIPWRPRLDDMSFIGHRAEKRSTEQMSITNSFFLHVPNVVYRKLDFVRYTLLVPSRDPKTHIK